MAIPQEALTPQVTSQVTSQVTWESVRILAIITAIPVSMFALWMDYYGRAVDRLIEEDPKFDRGSAMTEVRMANLFVMLFELVIFAGSSNVRQAYPAAGYGLLLAAFGMIFWVQSGIEEKIRQHETSAGTRLSKAFRAFFWSSAAAAVYLAVLAGSLIGFAWIAHLLHTPTPLTVMLLLTGASVGIIGGLFASFALAPFFVARGFRATPLEQPEVHAALKEQFEKHGMPLPAVHVIEASQLPTVGAMITGFMGGKGVFRPALFMTQMMIEKLSPQELQAVVGHELSHLKLRHIRKRLILSSGLILCSSWATGILVVAGMAVFPQATEAGKIIALATLAASCFYSFHLISRQTRYQEHEADTHCVEHFQVPLDQLAQALRRLDQLNDPVNPLLAKGHPQTEFRIEVLTHYINNKEKARREKEVAKEQKAA